MASTAITPVDRGRSDLIPIEEIKQMREQVQQLLRDVMQEGIDNDYAIIPGTKKKSLLKPGAEKICSMFRFAVDPVVEVIQDGDDVTYRVFVRLTATNGRFLGAGIGECSTRETKYAWRQAVCEEEWETAPYDKRRQHWKAGYNGEPTCILQVRENPSDKANTVLKMAKKRGLVDAILTVTACSDIFTQDIDDEHPDTGKKTNNQPVQTQKTVDHGPIVSPKAAGRFYAIWKGAGRNPADVKLYLERVCNVDDSRKMAHKFYEEACRWAATNEPVPSSSEQKEAQTAFSILGWDEKAQSRFIEQYNGDWKKILGELNILVVKKEGQSS